MSRHTHIEEKNGVKYEVICGFDKPLSEYFLQVYLADPELEDEEEDEFGDPRLLFSIASVSTLQDHPEHPGKKRWSNGEIFIEMKKWGCAKEHCHQVAMDLPF